MYNFTMVNAILDEMRITQWVKNSFIFVAVILSSKLFNFDITYQVIKAFIIFSILSSSIYILNDIFDIKKDMAHPIKKNRPLASGKITVPTAMFFSLWLMGIAFITGFLYVNRYFFIILVTYFVIQLLYNLKLKNVIILDALVITVGFILRLYAGAVAANVPVSSWLVLSTIGVALLLALGKRRAEVNLLKAKNINFTETRELLHKYPLSLLDSMITMSATYSIITYSLFSHFDSPEIKFKESSKILQHLPLTLADARWLLATIPFAIYGVARYLYIIYEKNEGESPHKSILSDAAMLINLFLWLILIIAIYYGELFLI